MSTRLLRGSSLPAFLLVAAIVFMAIPTAASLEGLQVGMEAPDFSLKDIDGNESTFATFDKGKLTALVFWSTWSANSGKALSRMEELHGKYAEKGLSIVAVNVEDQQISDETAAAIAARVKELGLTFPVLLDRGLTVFHDYGVIAVPTTVILDSSRVIQYVLPGYPLIGSEEMVDYIAATIEGREPAKAVVAEKTGYRPDKKALRFWNMGNKSLKSRRMASMAEQWYQKAIEADDKFVLPHLSLGKFYVQNGKSGPAAEQFAKAVEKDPENVIALCELGLLRVREGQTEQGKELLEKAMALSDSYASCYYYFAVACGQEGNMEEAVSWFDKGFGINPNDYTGHVLRASMFEEKGNLEEAAASYRTALKLVRR